MIQMYFWRVIIYGIVIGTESIFTIQLLFAMEKLH